MNVIADLERFAGIANLEDVRARVSEAMHWIPSAIQRVIPSTMIGLDGITLASIFLVSVDHLTEVRLSTPMNHFDITRSILRNINVEKGKVEVQTSAETKVVYYTAKVLLIHSSEGHFGSAMHYAGKEPADEWLTLVRETFPVAGLSVVN
ncbi:hypothetical protein N5I87_23775 [Ralstonia sp. CHL-2022]|uniref:Uncharacterized protein n=1 Tax=Ralstonia mojiangensis TaxID=2953895 RepID=A0AAE3I7E9_9RALS|nr:hypothetical protein [Ralstonia mojiangensis]MCT7319048.1 hypothetical protein [Ralstonia mojiangensis]